MNNGFNSNHFPTAIFADCLANSKEIFQLIDQIFPVDSCRHYGVLPLKLVGNNLTLGMLDPHNEESSKFVNSIAKVFQYNLEIQLIDSQIQQIILASYPQNSTPPQNSRQDQNQTVVDTSLQPSEPPQGHTARKLADSAPTIISQPNLTEALPDLPSDLDFLKDSDATPQSTARSTKPKADLAATLYEIPPEFTPPKKRRNLDDDKPTIIGADPTQLLADDLSQKESEIAFAEAQISELIAETVGGAIDKSRGEIDFLPKLVSQLSWQKLLDRAFEHRTEYLYLKRSSDRASAIAERNKAVQSSVEEVPLPIFCSLIDEIKRMARIPQHTTSHPKKVVLERFYNQERILLRIEFSLQESIEKVDIQILRDRGLRIYEQQQMDKVSEQALQLAKQLEKTLRRIQACFDSAELTNLQELQAVYMRISHQLRLLGK
jgi:hypothetical protein